MTVGSVTLAPVQQATRTIPIVFVNVADPVGAGFVQSLARPGGNTTGFTNFEYSMSGKWVELLKQIAPRVTRVAVLRDPTVAAGIGQFSAIQSVAQSLGIELTPFSVRDVAEIERGIAAFARSGNGGLIVTAGGTGFHRDLIIRLASRYKLPAVYPFRYYAKDGGLISYGPDTHDPIRRAAGLRRPHPQRREAGRLAGAGADKVRTGDQSQDCQGAWPRPYRRAPRPRRRGDRIGMLSAALHEFAIGT